MSENNLTDFEIFIKEHYNQLSSSGIPVLYWKNLHHKLSEQIFDAGLSFTLIKIDCEDSSISTNEPLYQLQVKLEEGLNCKEENHIYLIDHAWTYRVEQARRILKQQEKLLFRMANIMGIKTEDIERNELIDLVFRESWKYSNTYSIGNAEEVENRMPIWYILDEVGSAVRHSNDPNFRMVPFIYIKHNITYSLLFPIKDCKFADVVTRDFIEGTPIQNRCAFLLPWILKDFSQEKFLNLKADPDYFLSGHIKETLPILKNLQEPKIHSKALKVFTQYKYVFDYLTDGNFELVASEEEADILWLTKHFKNFEQLSIESPHKMINQFPFEYILTVKDLLSMVCRLKHADPAIGEDLKIPPAWLPVTYNLKTEVTQFVSYYQNRCKKGLDNHWIVKPFNLARGLDTHITDDLNQILRLQSSGPKIAQKYIEKPVLFDRPDVLQVKFDIRYVILLKCIKPLDVYVYKNFFLRFANVPFELRDFDVYEQHFTVMNYCEETNMKHMLCAEFLQLWERQYPNNSWVDDVEEKIFQMLREVFECATMEPPPCGISESPQSRALYAADIMLAHEDGEICPKLLEINWTPDCKRACEYYKEFFNDIFKLLFLDVENIDVFHKL